MKTKIFSIFALFFAAIVTFISCEKDDKKESVQFSVVSIDPPSGSVGVSPGKIHLIKFSDEVSEASVPDHVMLKDKFGDLVPIEVVWRPDNAVSFVIMRDCIWLGMNYTVIVKGVKSTTGETVKDFSSTFTLSDVK